MCVTQMFKFVLYENIIFDILEQFSFQKYTTCWVFLALRHMLYLYICVFVFLYLCVRHPTPRIALSVGSLVRDKISAAS